MKVDKSQVVELLRSRGDHSTAAQAAMSLPNRVDTEHHQEVLHRFGVDLSDLIANLSSGRTLDSQC